MNGWRQMRAIALLPGNVTITVPALILVLIHGPHFGWGLGVAPAALVVTAGIGLIVAGFYVWLWTVRLFDRSAGERLRPGTRPACSSLRAPTGTCATR